jgi:flavin reductase (DIM6/NTAB) family NADH-FMN oxidoreductase RutF
VIDEMFEDLTDMLDYPVFVVTTQVAGQPSGCLVSFAGRASANPPIFQVCIPKSSDTFTAASRTQHLAVHVLARHHRTLAELFGGRAANDAERFHRCRWRAGPEGMPILDDAIAWFVGRIIGWVEVGDHVLYALQPAATWVPESADDPLYLSDLDDSDAGDDPSHRSFGSAPSAAGEVTRRYGVKFTLGGF